MKRGMVLALAAALCACAPAPVQMPAARASEVLSLFAAGAGPASICSSDGRALLRGAVRSYSREMERSGVTWPVAPGAVGQNVTNVDMSVMIAFAAGFVKAGDLQGAPRRMMNQLALMQWPEIQSIRLAAGDACDEVVALHQAAASFLVESARMNELSAGAGERVQRQSLRVRRARENMLLSAAVVETRMEQAGL